MNHRRRWWTAALVLAAASAAIAALAASTGGARLAQQHVMTPAAGPVSLYKAIGQPLASANGNIAFSCQTASYPGICYGPSQIRAAYGIQPLLDRGLTGAGRTIVIIDAFGSPTIQSDLRAFDKVWRLPAPNFQVVAPFGVASTDPDDAAGWAGETSLDVEWSHAVAPGANILLVVAKSDSDSDILNATQWVSSHNAGDVLSQSYGEAELCMDPSLLAQQDQLFAKMSKQGITLFASSGDTGAAQYSCDGSSYSDPAVSTPASDPYVTGVGGTTLIANGTTGRYQSESAWNETALLGGPSASGGGVSAVYSSPSYQGLVEHNPMRTVPDVSYNAAVGAGVIVAWSYEGSQYWVFGGTSAGSPQWAGITAITDQLEHGRVGQINQALYSTRGSSQFFHDITTGDNNVGVGSSYTAGRGYDLVTGLGTPIASSLVPYLAVRGLLSDNDFGSKGSSHGGFNGRQGHKHDH